MLGLISRLFFSRVFFHKKGGWEEFQVESLHPYKENFILKLKGIDSLERAQGIARDEVFVPEEKLPSLREDDYYHFQILGCTVMAEDGEKIGMVEDFLTIPGNDLLVVRGRKGQILIPFNKDICVQINLEQREIIVNPPAGLLDLNEI
jgi:16S rRNA processing protein RimM